MMNLVYRMSKRGKITERTLYPFIMEIIRSSGGTSVSEIKYDSEPDIVFDLLEHRWLMSVKIGESQKIIKNAFVDYFRHRRESGIESGIIVFFPEEIRKTKPVEDAIRFAVGHTPATCLVDAQTFQTQIKDTLPKVFEHIIDRIKEKYVRACLLYTSDAADE